MQDIVHTFRRYVLRNDVMGIYFNFKNDNIRRRRKKRRQGEEKLKGT